MTISSAPGKSVFSLWDLLKGLVTAGKIYGRPEEAYLLAAIIYFVLCFGLSWLVRRLQARIAIIR